MRSTIAAVFLFLLFCCAARADTALDLVAAARTQVGVTLFYDSSYQRIAYPMGDVPMERGVCSDVVIRAFRVVGIDLQQELHRDMKRHFAAYPKNWGLAKPDRNIDHRRVPNLATWFKRQGYDLPVSRDAGAYQPGDIVTWILGGGQPHIGIVSDERSNDGARPLVVVPPGDAPVSDKVLVGYDGSVPAMRALQLFALLRPAGETQVRVLSVAEERAEALRLAEGAAAYLRTHGFEAEAVGVEGSHPVEALLAEAAAMPAGLLVMGSYEESGLRTFFTGSATRRLLHAVPCPVFVAH